MGTTSAPTKFLGNRFRKARPPVVVLVVVVVVVVVVCWRRRPPHALWDLTGALFPILLFSQMGPYPAQVLFT